MRWLVAAACCLAACSSQPGVDLKIHTDGVAFDAVELYIAKSACDTCNDGVGWPTTMEKVPGDVWLMEGDELVVRSDVLVDGAGVIHLEAAPGFDHPRAIAIVAFKGGTDQGEIVAATVLHDKTIPVDAQESWSVTLHATQRAAVPEGPPTSAETDTRALAWVREPGPAATDPTGYAGCLAYQAWDGNNWNTEYFVPATDPDCDGAPPDCDPYWNHAPTTAPLACVKRPVAMPAVCALGKKTCTTEDTSTCMVSDNLTCVPDAWCSCAPDDVRTCIKNQFLDPSTTDIPNAHCTFTVNPGNPTSGCIFNNQGEIINFLVPGACAPPSAMVPIAGLRIDPFSADATMIGISGGAKIMVHASLTGTMSAPSCNIGLQWQLGTSVGNATPIYVSVWMTDRQLLVPVWLDFSAGGANCPTSTQTCTRTGWPEAGMNLPGDTLFQCAQ